MAYDIYVDGPREYRCPTCKAEPGEPCRSRQAQKVLLSHMSRQDRLIRASWK